MRADDRGVSDVLGFVFVFSLVVLTTATVVAVGVPGLQDARDAEQVSNAERAFDVLAENVDDVAVRDAPGRGTEIRLSNARLGFGERTFVRVNVTSGGERLLFREVHTDTISYAAGDSRLVYEGTGVFRTEYGGSVTVRPPTLVATPERTVLTLVELDGDGQARGGSGVVLVRTERTGRGSSIVRDASRVTVTVETDPRRADAWERTLERSTPGADDCRVEAPADGTVVCSYATETVVVTETAVSVTYEN